MLGFLLDSRLIGLLSVELELQSCYQAVHDLLALRRVVEVVEAEQFVAPANFLGKLAAGVLFHEGLKLGVFASREVLTSNALEQVQELEEVVGFRTLNQHRDGFIGKFLVVACEKILLVSFALVV